MKYNDLWVNPLYWPITESSSKTGYMDPSSVEAQLSGIYFVALNDAPSYVALKGFGPLEKTVSGANIIRRLAGSPYPELKAKYDRYFRG